MEKKTERKDKKEKKNDNEKKYDQNRASNPRLRHPK